MNLRYIISGLDYEIPYKEMNVKIVRFTFLETDPGLFSPKHIHKDYEFHYVKSGRGRVNIDGCEFEVFPGSIYYTKPFVNHSEYSCPEEPLVLYCFECTIDFPDEYASVLDKFELENIKDVVNQVYQCPFQDNKGIIEKLGYIDEIIREGALGYRLRSKIFILDVIVSTIQIVLQDKSIRYPLYKEDINVKRIDVIKNFVQANIQNKITLEDVGKMMFFSPKQINRMLLKEYNQTFSRYVMNLRIDIVKELLVTTNEDITQIAKQAGFCSYLQLYRRFVSNVKMSPTEYRKKYQSEKLDTSGENEEGAIEVEQDGEKE